MKKLKVVIFTSKDHIYANKMIKALYLLPYVQIVGIVESGVIYPGKGTLSALLWMYFRAGPKYLFFQISKFIFFKFGSRIYSLFPDKKIDHHLFSYQLLVKKTETPIISESDINSPSFLKIVSRLKPQLFISIFHNQIFKKELLSKSRYGTINVHPAYLPAYRGLTPTAWVLARGEKNTGITIHRIQDEMIDAGDILAQKVVRISKKETEYALYWKCVNAGIPLLISVVFGILHGVIPHSQKTISKKSSYYSLPTRKIIEALFKNGHRFCHWHEFISLG